MKHSSYSQIVVFGDSLSDNGNGTYLFTNKAWPADPAYFDGRFSNGQTWVELLAHDLSGNKIDNRAYGGSTVNNSRIQGYTGRDSTIPVPSVLENVHKYIKHHGHGVDPHALYILSGGGNDAFYGSYERGLDPVQLARSVAADLDFALRELNAAGAHDFLVPSTPALQNTPYGKHYGNATIDTFLRSFSDAFACDIKKQRTPRDARVALWNEEQAFAHILRHARQLGYTSLDTACLKGVYNGEANTRSLCSDADKHVFWDIYHPTAKTHGLLAEAAKRELKREHLGSRHLQVVQQVPS
ncbi:carbohydrate esterase family 16 protein [Tilletiaria anomala UBC 951]|uniref:Carbohydrate esterase family 16 protein n=1 Tax=Tilletiaria anomala (strain ATCC 24038 / CBS 436.72 / UBC 951) TaxID=1037660 RepID=A0A066WNN2_TILAU|nr:carbohydrate esterase family 16 protein [Tilletiaria anomala UBC 951]KDN52225.1 carbohydrate esterase family 16 protein [Tilletiaria anomala UBC 951]